MVGPGFKPLTFRSVTLTTTTPQDLSKNRKLIIIHLPFIFLSTDVLILLTVHLEINNKAIDNILVAGT